MFILLAGFFQANKGGVTPVFLMIAGILLVPGYGLFSLWWLVIKFRKISLSTVPFFIYGGLAAGTLTGLLFISPFLRGGFGPPTPYITMYDNFKSFVMIGGGPLIVLITLILLLWLKEK
ncbi:MAG: hypothetical protein A2052_09520 [Deltaproteobacteria bacterium GWA2_54_12]|nr:MAG: hypothetical protein A2052_09520 [Deltaproteobacteria bacterium GWA2_54_12]